MVSKTGFTTFNIKLILPTIICGSKGKIKKTEGKQENKGTNKRSKAK